MTSIFNRALAVIGMGIAGIGLSTAPGWSACDTPTTPLSADFNTSAPNVANELMRAVVGLSGTVTHGGTTTDPCWRPNTPAFVGQVAGGLAFSAGSQGSIQNDFDDNMAYVYGAQFEPARPWCFVTINVDGTRASFGSAGIGGFFDGASGRYVTMDSTSGGLAVNLRVDVIGDAARMQWTISNPTTAEHTVSLWFGGWMGLLSETTGESSGVALRPFGLGNGAPYVLMPGRRPIATQVRITRSTDQNFPDYADIYFDQARPYGFRLENGPTQATSDQSGLNSDADFADEIVFGDPGNLIGGYGGDHTFTDRINADAPWGAGSTTAFLQKFRDKIAPVNGTVQFVHYFRTTWGISNYSEPYAVVADAPTIIQTDTSQPSGLQNDGVARIGVDVDNSGRPGFTDANKPFAIQTVRVSISFPQTPESAAFPQNPDPVQLNSVLHTEYGKTPTFPNGLALAPGETSTKSIPGSPALRSLEMKSLIFNITADGIASGDLPYIIKIQPSTGPIKYLHGTINVAATPRVHLQSSPQVNLITAPWEFSDSSWEAILGLPSSQFAAFDWDALQNGYVLSSSAARGIGTWIIYYGSDPSYNNGSAFYQANPQPPTDLTTGAPQVQLHSGWNLIGNPYNYSVPLAQVVGVSDANNTQALSWQELVNAGIVANFLAYWDPIQSEYRYLQDINENVQPNFGYWVFVQTAQDLTIQFPPVFAPGVGGTTGPSPFRVRPPSNVPTGSILWKLQLAARSNGAKDSQNFIGSATDATTAAHMSILKPPTSPVSDLKLGISRTAGVTTSLYAQSLTVGTGAADYNVVISSKKGGTVNFSWPTISSLPNTLGATVTDATMHTSQDMRRSANYIFALPKNGSRTLTIHVVPVSNGANLLSGLSRTLSGGSAMFSYRLSASARTSAKIMTLSGLNVVTLTTNRPDSAGLDTVTWNLRDSSGRPVPSGQYVFVISATTTNGQVDTKQLQFSR